jgi:transcriptional regulator with XRE-family HTH domain
MEIRQRIAKNTRRLIAQKGLTIRGFAREYGFSAASLSRILAGEGSPGILLLDRLARALNTTIEKLLQ